MPDLRFEKIKNLKKLKHARTYEKVDSITEKEAEEIFQGSIQGPPVPLYAWTPQGYVDIHRVKSTSHLQKIYDSYAVGKSQLYTIDELEEIGLEPWEGEIDDV